MTGWIFDKWLVLSFFTVDVWDGPDGQPVIYHGHTLTGMLLVKDVLHDAIKPYAFKSSPYPLFLSFENHLCVEQQAVLAAQIKDTIGGLAFLVYRSYLQKFDYTISFIFALQICCV